MLIDWFQGHCVVNRAGEGSCNQLISTELINFISPAVTSQVVMQHRSLQRHNFFPMNSLNVTLDGLPMSINGTRSDKGKGNNGTVVIR